MSSRPSLIARWVTLCTDRAWIVLILTSALFAVASAYAVRHFAMSTNTYELLSPQLPWRIRETEFNVVFPRANPKIVVVVDGRTPELVDAATAAFVQSLSTEPTLFRAAYSPDFGSFWAHNGLLYASTQEVQTTMAKLINAEPFLGPMAADPSLRGLMGALSTAAQGVKTGQASFATIRSPVQQLAETLEGLHGNERTYFSWRKLISGGAPDKQELRHLILVDPSVDFSQLEPGAVPTAAIRSAAKALQLDDAHGVRVRITGLIPLQDEEFATLAERAPLIAVIAFAAITLMLWLAVRAISLIVAILATTLVGLVGAAALGLAVFHRFNVISVAFIPLFVGLGIDLGIQFSVRYRAERGADKDVRGALIATGRGMGRSLTLAATAIAAGFLAFAPTAYYGVSQLGVIAGLGMLIALALNLSLLPALIRLVRPPGAPTDATDPGLARVDNWVLRQRVLVVCAGVALAVISAGLLPLLHFDFNPLHLRSAKVESVATLYDLTSDPRVSPNTLEAIRPDLAAADQLAARVGALPEVSLVRTLSSFVPADQAGKISIIADAANLLDLALNPVVVAPPPNDAQVIESLRETSTLLRQVATEEASAADAARLARDLEELAQASPAARSRVAQQLIPGLAEVLGQVRDSLQPQLISVATLPPELVSAWLTPDGRARVSVTPKGDANDNEVLTRFVAAGTQIIPDATGTPLSIHEAGRAVVRAFAEAGALSFVAITVLLFAALRRVRDVAVTMAPIVLTGLLTMGSCVVMGQPLNFANIIALPLLFGIGVAFHIYFVMAWRAGGGAHLLTSSLARAVFFSALATATGFGSLWASSHPGTASMGKLLMISLVWTLISALLFQPALMGVAPHTGASAN